MQFVSAFGWIGGPGYINLDLVASVHQRLKGGKFDGYNCLDISGQMIGAIDELPSSDLIVPNAQPVEFFGCWLDDEDGRLGYVRQPVLAWKIAFGVAEPILADDPPEDWSHWFLGCNGHYWAYDEGASSDLQVMLDTAKARLTRIVERRKERQREEEQKIAETASGGST